MDDYNNNVSLSNGCIKLEAGSTIAV